MRKRGSCESATRDRLDTDVGRQIRIALTATLSVPLFAAYGDSSIENIYRGLQWQTRRQT